MKANAYNQLAEKEAVSRGTHRPLEEKRKRAWEATGRFSEGKGREEKVMLKRNNGLSAQEKR